MHFWQNDPSLFQATVATQGDNACQISQHRKLTLEKKILPPLLLGLDFATFRLRVRHSTNKLSQLPVDAVNMYIIILLFMFSIEICVSVRNYMAMNSTHLLIATLTLTIRTTHKALSWLLFLFSFFNVLNFKWKLESNSSFPCRQRLILRWVFCKVWGNLFLILCVIAVNFISRRRGG